MSRYTYRKKRKGRLTKPILISVFIHLFVLVLLLLGNQNLFKFEAKKDPPKKDDFIEITEFTPPDQKKVEPLKKAKLLAAKSNVAKEEKTKDKTTRITKKSPPKSKVAKKPKIQSKPKEIKKKDEVLRDHKLASLPKKKWLRRNQDKSNIPESLAKRENLQSPDFSSNSLSDLPPLLGSRNVPKKEETVDLNTQEFKYYSYFLKLKRQIEGVWHYPKESAQRGEQGHLNVIFTITKTGYLEDVKIVRSSGYGRLDSEAIRAIRIASPYSPFPKSWGRLEKLNVKATFEYNFAWKLR